VVLSILEPANNAPARYQTSQHAPATHTLHISEGDAGIYAGTLQFTNQLGAGVHPVRLALRSAQGGGASAYLDLTQSPFFSRALSLPVTLSTSNLLVNFPVPVQFTSTASTLQKSLTWTLQFGAVNATTNGTYESSASLALSGLSASGRAVTAQGLLRLIRVSPTQ